MPGTAWPHPDLQWDRQLTELTALSPSTVTKGHLALGFGMAGTGLLPREVLPA